MFALLSRAPVFAGQQAAPAAPTLGEIAERLTRLEDENRELLDEVRELRKELTGFQNQSARRAPPPESPAAAPSVEEKLAVSQARIEELAQTKVEASQKFPIRLTGMALFNAYVNSRANSDVDNPTIASPAAGRSTTGATLRQTTIGLSYSGPRTLLGGEISGSLAMDFFGGSTSALNHTVRLRTATIRLDWSNTSLLVGQDKPLISPRTPISLAQVGVPPLTDAGDLWVWQPQIRIEHRFGLGPNSGVQAQLGVFQTALLGDSGEYGSYLPSTTTAADNAERAQPGLEGRVELWKKWGDNARLEVAPGFHVSRDHVGGFPVPSRIFSLDWLLRPVAHIEFSGMFFHGQNVAAAGGLRQGFTVYTQPYRIHPVHAAGGWSQLRIPVTARLAFDIYGGQEDDRNSDLLPGSIGRNREFAANLIYRLAPNVLASFEAAQLRTTYLGLANRINNHYDLALGYMF